MKEFILYFKLKNFGVDEQDNPCDVGMTISLGQQKEDVDYDKVASALNLGVLLENTGLGNFVTVDDIEIITPEEYEEEFGGEGE